MGKSTPLKGDQRKQKINEFSDQMNKEAASSVSNISFNHLNILTNGVN